MTNHTITIIIITSLIIFLQKNIANCNIYFISAHILSYSFTLSPIFFTKCPFSILTSDILAASFNRYSSFNNLSDSIFIFLFMYLLDSPNIIYGLVLIILSYSTRIVGEALNIKFYKKYNYIWHSVVEK